MAKYERAPDKGRKSLPFGVFEKWRNILCDIIKGSLRGGREVQIGLAMIYIEGTRAFKESPFIRIN